MQNTVQKLQNLHLFCYVIKAKEKIVTWRHLTGWINNKNDKSWQGNHVLENPFLFHLARKKSRWKISFMCIEKTCQKEPIIEISSNCQGDLHFSLFSLNGSSEAPCKQLGLCIFDVDFLPRFTVGKWFSSLQNRQFSSELFILAWFLAILKLFLLIYYWKYCPAELDRTSLKISTFKKKIL